tara:strand:+ start:56 stop:331 length:276 start_codon:yes stop_codon:yes gene_type:complete
MKNYKITNNKTKAVYYLTEPQKERFFEINTFYDAINKIYNYRVQNIKDINNAKFNRKLENICFTVIAVCIMIALYLGLCELLQFIDKTTIN